MTGGGVQALAWLLGVPGASRTILEARVPYSSTALADFLGYEPRQVVSPKTARDMARRAHRRARRLGPDGPPLVGIGCTAAIATDRPKRGEHRCFISAWTDEWVATYGVTFAKGRRDRAGEDGVVSKLVLRALAEASGVEFDLPLALDDGERVQVVRSDHGDLIQQLLAGDVRSVTIHPDGDMVADETVRGGVLSGSFDPLHRGHEELAKVAEALLGTGVSYELSVVNVDKPPLERGEVSRRLAQLAGTRRVVLTRAPTFHEKAGLFPGCTFVIGWDTAVRLVDPRYYGRDEAQMLKALTDMRSLGCRLLVAGRVDGGVFHTLDEVPVPSDFEEMFNAIPEAAFRCDLSSTQLRVAGRQS